MPVHHVLPTASVVATSAKEIVPNLVQDIVVILLWDILVLHVIQLDYVINAIQELFRQIKSLVISSLKILVTIVIQIVNVKILVPKVHLLILRLLLLPDVALKMSYIPVTVVTVTVCVTDATIAMLLCHRITLVVNMVVVVQMFIPRLDFVWDHHDRPSNVHLVQLIRVIHQ
tara:strand:+ start:132 stop:647 length:516 start_codon:yes stop_codon:yes gene_type:complete